MKSTPLLILIVSLFYFQYANSGAATQDYAVTLDRILKWQNIVSYAILALALIVINLFFFFLNEYKDKTQN